MAEQVAKTKGSLLQVHQKNEMNLRIKRNYYNHLIYQNKIQKFYKEA
jgi:hypothetical protein